MPFRPYTLPRVVIDGGSSGNSNSITRAAASLQLAPVYGPPMWSAPPRTSMTTEGEITVREEYSGIRLHGGDGPCDTDDSDLSRIVVLPPEYTPS